LTQTQFKRPFWSKDIPLTKAFRLYLNVKDARLIAVIRPLLRRSYTSTI